MKNVGRIDAYMRITMGLFMFGKGINKNSNTEVFLGSMKVAEGITRFCPMFYLLGLSSNNKSNSIKKVH